MSRMSAGLLIASCLFLSGCEQPEPVVAPTGPVEWSVVAGTDKTEVQVGEDFELSLTVTHPVDGDFVPPPADDFLPFTVIDNRQEEVSPSETRLHFRLAAYLQPGELELVPLRLSYRDDAGEIATLTTDPIAISLVTSLTPDVTEIHDIKGPVELPIERDWSLFWWLLAALLAALVAYALYRKYRKEPEAAFVTEWVAPLPAPDIEAERALVRLAEKNLIEQGQLTLFYTELTDIMRRYAGRRFEIPYLERTTVEILMDLRRKKISNSSLRSLLEAADLVKFARQAPEPDEAAGALSRAHELVRETKPAPSVEVSA